MKIQFINAVLGGDYSALDIAITTLATYLNERTDHKAGILDMTFHRRSWRKHLESGVKKFQPDIIGISCNTLYMRHVRDIMKEVKEKYDLPIVLGGYHASIKPEDTIEIPEATAICIGDGEYSLTEYLTRYEKGESAEGIKGIWAKEKGRTIKNQRGYFIQDLDSLPTPNWDLWEDIEKYFYYLGMLYFIGTRGCPYRCTYCDAHGISKAVDGPYYRVRDPVKYAQEIAYQWSKYKNSGMRLAQLFDQVFTLDEKWVKAFCEEYARQGLSGELPFSIFSRIDNLNENKVKMLAKAGCAILRVGVEAGDEFIRNEVYRKNISNDQITKIFRLCKENGVGFTAFFMLGGPGETPETMQRSLNLAVELDANRTAFFIYKPFTEEGLKQIREFGGWVDEERWSHADNITFDAVIASKNLSPRQVEWFQRKAYFITAGRRILKLIAMQKHRYFINFAAYMGKGLMDGLDPMYMLPYFHIYGYENVKL